MILQTQKPDLKHLDPNRPDRMPVLIVSGFLGAGKTTFLNQLLGTPPLADSLIIVNEFGDAGLDGLFLAEEAQASGSGLLIEELTSGCLCCTLQGPLITTLEDLLRARDNGRIVPFRQLIIETTGLADPSPILAAFAKHPYLSLRYLVGGIVTLVDAAQEPSALDATPEASAQVAVADVLALSKTDLVDAGDVARLEGALAARNPTARIASTPDLLGQTDWLDALLAQSNVPTSQPELDQTHEHHAHNHAHSVVVRTNQPLEQRVVAMFMDLLGMNMPGDLLRVKGLVWIAAPDQASPPQAWAVHAAGPLQHPPRPIAQAMAAKLEPMASQIVVITRTDQSARINDLFQACLRQNRA